MSNPNLNRDSDGRFRSKATWKEEVLEILLRDQARRSVSDAEYTEILDDDTSWGDDHGRAVAVWAEHREEDSWYGCPECKRTNEDHVESGVEASVRSVRPECVTCGMVTADCDDCYGCEDHCHC